MTEIWKTYSLAEVSKKITYGYTASATQESAGNPKFLRITDIQGGVVNWENVPYCEIEGSKRSQYKLSIGDIVIARTGNSTGENTVIKDSVDAVFASYLIRYQIDATKVNPFFLAYQLRSPQWFGFVQGIKGGSAQAGANAQQFALFKFKCPESIEEQRRIAEILSALDEKIELNLQMNATLERIAQATFKHWFVDFQFPDFDGELVDGLPKGWQQMPIDKIAEFLNGLALQKFPPEDETVYLPVIKIRELRQGITESSDKASRNVPSQYIVNDGDILFSWSGSLEVVIWCNGKGALNQHLFKITSKDFPKWFYYFWTLHHLPRFRAIAEGKATTMGHIQRRHLTESLVNIPTESLLNKASEVIKPIFERMIEVKLENQTLTRIRDGLLPKLMSGKIRVPV